VFHERDAACGFTPRAGKIRTAGKLKTLHGDRAAENNEAGFIKGALPADEILVLCDGLPEKLRVRSVASRRLFHIAGHDGGELLGTLFGGDGFEVRPPMAFHRGF